jgi:hypothetical protein
MAELLLQKGANINLTVPGKEATPIVIAAEEGHVHMVRKLREAGAIYQGDKDLEQRMMRVAIKAGSSATMEALLELGCKPDRALFKLAVDARKPVFALLDLILASIEIEEQSDSRSGASPSDTTAPLISPADQRTIFNPKTKPAEIFRLFTRLGLRSALIQVRADLMAKIQGMESLLTEGKSSTLKQRRFALYCLVATLEDSELNTYYRQSGLSESTAERLTQRARGHLEVFREIGEARLKSRCLPALRLLVDRNIDGTSLALVVNNKLAARWNSIAGLVPPLAKRVHQCWEQALESAKADRLPLTTLDQLAEELQLKLRPYFARSFLSIRPGASFYDNREQNRSNHAYHLVLTMQRHYVTSYCEGVLEAERRALLKKA